MTLNYKKLLQFDLLKDIEERLIGNQENVAGFLEFLNIYQEIKNADQFIKELPSFPYSTKNIIRGELVSAIGSTLAIEGISLRADEIQETLQESGLKENIERKNQEVLNSRNVYDYIRREVDNCQGDFVYTIEHICTIHQYITENISYPGNYPGKFRNCTATFGDPRKPSFCDNYDSIYVAIKYFVEWLNDKGSGPWSTNIFAKALMAHYYLTEIHPFGDGNGRVARALAAMVLYVNRVNSYCFWSLANFWSANRNEYIFRLGDIRKTCNPYDFILWGAKGYLAEVERIKFLVLRKVKQLMFSDYISYLVASNKERPAKKRINRRIANVLRLLVHMGKNSLEKFRSDPAYKAYYSNCSVPTANRDQVKMQSLDLIRITKMEGENFIEPNYEIFNDLEYRI